MRSDCACMYLNACRSLCRVVLFMLVFERFACGAYEYVRWIGVCVCIYVCVYYEFIAYNACGWWQEMESVPMRGGYEEYCNQFNSDSTHTPILYMNT